MDDGVKKVESSQERAQLRRQAYRVYLQSFLLAGIGTALAVLLPF